MYLKEKIRYTGNDVKLKISLSSNNNLNGLQESINDYIERETGLSINPATDGETFRIQNSLSTKTLQFKFYDGFTYNTSLLNAGFTLSEITESSDSYKSSFYVMQVFNIMNVENQILLHTGFLNGANFIGVSTSYPIASTSEFSNIYIEENYLNSISANTITVYAKFFFYNAKFGKLQPFFNESNELLNTEDKLYHPIQITKSTRKYLFTNSSNIVSKEFINTNYIAKINDSLDSFSVEKPTYPIGTKFNSDGSYEIDV